MSFPLSESFNLLVDDLGEGEFEPKFEINTSKSSEEPLSP